MAERVELNAMELESVVGGAFHYNTHTNDDGSEYMTCRVDDVGTYNCSENAKRKISLYFMDNPDASAEDAVNYALSIGVFW